VVPSGPAGCTGVWGRWPVGDLHGLAPGSAKCTSGRAPSSFPHKVRWPRPLAGWQPETPTPTGALSVPIVGETHLGAKLGQGKVGTPGVTGCQWVERLWNLNLKAEARGGESRGSAGCLFGALPVVQLRSSRTKQWEAATPDSHNRYSHALNSRARVKPTPGKGAKHDTVPVSLARHSHAVTVVVCSYGVYATYLRLHSRISCNASGIVSTCTCHATGMSVLRSSSS
jgi:hypothetical protein